jgi:hypothetical protein
MKTISQAPSRRTLGAGLTEAKRRRRWPRVVLWIAAFALLADTVGFMAYVSRYQPLDAGPESGVDQRQVVRELQATSPMGQSFSQFRIDDVQGSRFWYGFSITNGGRLPVTITSIGAEPRPGEASPLPQTGVRLGPDTGGGRFESLQTTAFEPFTLDAQTGRRSIVIDARIAGCRPDGVAAYYGAVDVTYKVLGFFSRRTTVTLPYTIEVPADAACRPARGEAGQDSGDDS